jgi:hypothetical protein
MTAIVILWKIRVIFACHQNHCEVPVPTKVKSLLIIITFILIIVLPVCYGLLREHSLQQKAATAQRQGAPAKK